MQLLRRTQGYDNGVMIMQLKNVDCLYLASEAKPDEDRKIIESPGVFLPFYEYGPNKVDESSTITGIVRSHAPK